MSTHDEYMTRRQARDLARRLARLERRQRSTAAAHADLRHSAIDGGKGLVLKDEQGQEKYRLGTDENGVTAPQYKGGPAPEQPEAPFVDVGGEVVKIQHSGLDVNENPAPADFRRAQIHVAQTETFEPSLSTLAGYLEEADGSFTHRLPGGEWYVGIVWETLSGKTSVMSATVLADIPPLVDAQDIQDTLDAAQEALDEYRDEVAAPRFQALEDGLSENADNLADARTRLSAAEQTLSPLPGEVAEARDFAEGAVESAEAAEARVVEAMANIQTVLPNGGFEAGLTNWESQGANLGSTTVHSGDQSVWLQANGWIRPEDPIAVREDQVWDLGFYYYFSVSNRHTLVTVEAVDDQDGRTELEQWTLSGLTGGQWHHTGPLRFEVPAGVSRVSFTISYVDHIVFVDNVALRDVTDVVRLERAATTARQAAEEAITRIEFMELAVDGEGGIRDQIADARDMLAEKADTSRLNELDGKLAQLGWDVTKAWRQDTPPPSGITYEWSDGEPHAAPSVQKVDGVDAAWNYMPNPSFESELETLSVGSRTTVGRTQFSSGVSSGQHGLTIAIAAGANNANAYIAQSFDVSPEMHGKWVGWSLLMRRSGLGLTAVRPYVTWGSVSDTQWMAGFDLTDAPLLEQPRHVYAIQVPVGATRMQIWYRFTATPTGGSPSSGDGHADDWVITVADTEDAALSGASEYWDGNSPDDRQNDLWYNSEGVPHEWVNGEGWTELSDDRINQLQTDVVQAAQTAYLDRLVVRDEIVTPETITNRLWADLGVFNRLEARSGWVGGTMLEDGAVTAEKITATRELITKIMGAEWAYIAQQLIVDGKILTRDLEALSAAIQSLTVTQRADIAELWAEELWTALAVIEELQAAEAWINSAMISELTAEKVTVTQEFVGRVAELLHLVVDRIDANALWADRAWLTAVEAASVRLRSVINDWQTILSGRGMEVISPEGQPTVQLGNFEETGLTLYGKNPDTGAYQAMSSMTDDGHISGQVIDANEELYYQGTELSEVLALEHIPRGVVAERNFRSQTGPYSTEHGIGYVGWLAVPGRMYKITISGYARPNSSSVTPAVRIRMSHNPSESDGYPIPSFNDEIAATFYAFGTDNNWRPVSGTTVWEYPNPELQANKPTRAWVTVGTDDGTSSGTSSRHQFQIIVEDIGLSPNSQSAWYLGLTGETEPSDPTPVKTRRTSRYTMRWWDTWWQNGNNPSYGAGTSELVQGRSPFFTTAGLYRSMVGFNSMTSDLAGADIEKIEVWMRVTHSHSSRGGTVRIGVHDKTGKPSSYSHTSSQIKDERFSRGQAKWVTLPTSTHAGFKSGSLRGITLYSSSTNSEYYVQVDPSSVQIRVTYRK